MERLDGVAARRAGHYCDEIGNLELRAHHVDRQRFDVVVGQRHIVRFERAFQRVAQNRAWRRQDPRVGPQVGPIERLSACKRMLAARHQHHWLLEQLLLLEAAERIRRRQAADDEVQVALPQFGQQRRGRAFRHHRVGARRALLEQS